MQSNSRSVCVSRRKLLAGASALALTINGMCSRKSAASGWFDVYATTAWDDFVNIRSAPEESAELVAQFHAGTTVRLLDGPSSEGWYLVEAVDEPVGVTGWVAGWVLIFEQRGRLYEDAPFFDQPGLWSTELGWIRHGFTVTLLSPVTDEFVLVRSSDRVGYVSIWSLDPAMESETDPYSEWWVDVNRSSAEVRLFVGNSVVDRFDASVSRDVSEGFYATAIGTYWIYQKIEELTYTPFADAYFRFWAGFDEDRFNGFHSWTMDAEGNVLNGGRGTTAGCVATEPADAAVIFAFVDVGTRVEIHW